MAKFIRIVSAFLMAGLQFSFFVIKLVLNGFAKNQILRKSNRSALILANGPSLSSVLPKITAAYKSGAFDKFDIMVMNYFAFDPVFQQLKPSHYCLVDPMFYKDTHRRKEVRRLFDLFEKVNWKMRIYILLPNYKTFLNYSNLKNPNLEIIPINSLVYFGFERFRNFFYRKGWAVPNMINISVLAIYLGLIQGAKSTYVFGVDHNFFEGLAVGKDNVLVRKHGHFYESDPKITPIFDNETGLKFTVAAFLQGNAQIFVSHGQLAQFAKSREQLILNCTENSLIDSYTRIDLAEIANYKQ